jgi:hypothetical protein
MKGVEAVAPRKRASKSCQHRWVIETPHGATSRGLCKRCGATKRFPNAAQDAMWESGGGLGRWANRKQQTIAPTRVTLKDAGK